MQNTNQANVKQFPGSENVLDKLKLPVPPEHIKQREGWRDRQGNVHHVSYVEWHTVADILDREAPDWSHTVKDIREIGDIITVTVAITVGGITREGIGTGTAESELGIKKAEHDALKRAAVKFGVARELYKKETELIEREGSSPGNYGSSKPANPVAKSMSDLITAKQLGMIRAVAREQNVDPDAECEKELGCRLDELSKRAASYFIQHLQSQESAPEPQSVPAKTETATPSNKPDLQAVPPRDEPANPRQIIAEEIFARGDVVIKDDQTYKVSRILEDESLEECTVKTQPVGGATCNCEDFKSITKRNNPKFKCEHILAARLFYAANSGK